MIFATAVLLFGYIQASLCLEYPPPPQQLDPTDFTDWSQTYGESRRADIHVPFTNEDGSDDFVRLYRLDLVGNAYERGFAHGALMAKEIVEFMDIGLSSYLIEAILNMDISGYPPRVQKFLRVIQIKGASVAPEIFNLALAELYNYQLPHTPTYLIEEMEAIADGMCYTFGPSCNVTKMGDLVKRMNMYPDLIKMACTAFGAWGPATESGKAIQLRALDLGGGPFANATTLVVWRERPSEATADSRAFAAVSFPGMVGIITGISQGGVGISEKVWYTSGAEDPPGTYDGESDVFVLRDALQHAKTKADAEDIFNKADRTWGIWAGVGDFTTQQVDIVGYQMASAVPYTDQNITTITSMPVMDSLVYVDKHAQPSTDPTLPQVLSDMYGTISLATGPIITQYHKTGDHHIAFYDFNTEGSSSQGAMILAIGRINIHGEYGPEGGDLTSWMAYNRPYLTFDLGNLWAGK